MKDATIDGASSGRICSIQISLAIGIHFLHQCIQDDLAALMQQPVERSTKIMSRQQNERVTKMAFNLANHLTRRYRWKLYAATAILTVVGILHGFLLDSPTAFPRYGALIALVTFWHASAQSKYVAMLQHDAEPIARELGQELGKDPARTISLLERLRTSVQRSFGRDYLVCGTIGVIVWGFGDLLLPAILHNTP